MPTECGFCHCRLCQRTSAVPALVYASFPAAHFRYSAGDPTIFESSHHGHREFCAKCGTQIEYRDDGGAATVDVNVGSLDDPSVVAPECHIWYRSKIPWFQVNDDLPRYEERKTE